MFVIHIVDALSYPVRSKSKDIKLQIINNSGGENRRRAPRFLSPARASAAAEGYFEIHSDTSTVSGSVVESSRYEGCHVLEQKTGFGTGGCL